jgi:hypothetical protein
MRLTALAPLALVSLLLAGCDAPPAPAGTHDSGVTGRAMAGPQCPVERNPPDPDCADKPIATNLTVTSADGSRAVRDFTSDADGRFRVPLAAGSYAIRSTETGGLPRCQSEPFNVTAGRFTDVAVDCDTGIR